MESFINNLHKIVDEIIDEEDIQVLKEKYSIDENCIKFIKIKNKKFFKIYFTLAIEKKNNLNNFIQIELDEYYKNYENENYDIFKAFQKYQIDELTNYKNKIISNNNFRENKQNEYINAIMQHLYHSRKCFIKAPTGFGKTVLYYKTIYSLKLKKILILTPRKMLNEQIVENKYIKFLNENKHEFKIIHYSNLSNSEIKNKYIKKIKKYQNNNQNYILTSCYQSKDNLLLFIK